MTVISGILLGIYNYIPLVMSNIVLSEFNRYQRLSGAQAKHGRP